jgi:hypothetical protein
MTNPSKRNEKAKFLIHIGNGFIVDSFCVRLDKLEPPVFGIATPNDWLMELCNELIYQRNRNDTCNYKSFIVELELKSITRAMKYDDTTKIVGLKKSREKLWGKKNKDEVNPSERIKK